MKLNDWLSQLSKLPEWQELPDIELYMDQLVNLGNRYLGSLADNPITSSMVNSYVKKNLIPKPQKKKYSQKHLVSLMLITLLKRAYSLDDIRIWLNENILKNPQKQYDHFSALFNQALTQISQNEFQLNVKVNEEASRELTLNLVIQTVLFKLISEYLIQSMKLQTKSK